MSVTAGGQGGTSSQPGSSLFLRLAKNAGFNAAARLWSVVLWIAVTPFVLHRLGAERFGVWSLLFLLSGYLATFDLGLGASVVRFTAHHASAGEWDRLRTTLSQISRLYLLLGIVWVLAIVLASHWILEWLRTPPVYRDEVRFAIVASSVVFAFANLVSVGVGVFNGLQRMDLSNGIMVGASIPQIGLLVFGLAHGQGLYAVVTSTALYWLLIAIATFVALRRIAPQAHWPSFGESGASGGWFRFSSVMQLVNVLHLTQQQLDKILLTTWMGLGAVTEFELGFRVANAVQSLPTLALSPLIPAIADLHAQGDAERLRRLWRRGMGVLIAVTMGAAVASIISAPLAVRAWVGPGHSDAERLAPWMLAAFCVNLLTGVGSATARGTGRPGMEILPAAVALAVHLAASAFFIHRYGTGGVGPSLLVAMVVWASLFLARFLRWLGEPVRSTLIAPLVRSGIAFALAWAAARSISTALFRTPASGRLALLMEAAVLSGGALAVYGVLWWGLGKIAALRSPAGPSSGTGLVIRPSPAPVSGTSSSR